MNEHGLGLLHVQTLVVITQPPTGKVENRGGGLSNRGHIFPNIAISQMVVLSVNRSVVAPVIALDKSFTNREKSVGPKTEPLGTPEGTTRGSDTELPTNVGCV